MNLTIKNELFSSKRLPTLPKEVQHLLTALTDDNLNFRQLAAVIKSHPTITARLLALANSAWAAPVTPVTSIEMACSRLGLSIVRSVSIGLAVIAPFNTANCPEFDIKRFWVTSMLVADGAVMLMPSAPKAIQTEHFEKTLNTVGILHNLGLLCLADQLPKEIQQAFKLVKDNPGMSLTQAIKELLDTDYCQLGGHLCELWGMPSDIFLPIKYQRDFDYRDQQWELSRVVGCSTLLVSCLFREEQPFQEITQQTGLTLDSEQQLAVFNKVKEQFAKTYEMAGSLFNHKN